MYYLYGTTTNTTVCKENVITIYSYLNLILAKPLCRELLELLCSRLKTQRIEVL